MTRPFHSYPRRGSSLITTLLVIVILAIIVTAFLQSMTAERQTARSYLNRYVAELAAESGVNEATNLLLKSDKDFPVNAYEEQTLQFNGTDVTAPYLVTIKPNPDGTSTPLATEEEKPRFLCSSINANDTTKYWRTPQDAAADTTVELVDINGRTAEFPKGFIGLAKPKGVGDDPAADYERRVVPVPWRELLADPTKPKDMDSKSNTYNPVVARFAYWVDDDSAKINIDTAGDADPDDEVKDNHLRRAGANLAEVALHEIFSDKPAEAGAAVKKFRDERKQDWFRATQPAFPAATYRLLLKEDEAIANDKIWQKSRPFVSSWAKSDERGAAGVRKINLNEFVKEGHDYQQAAGRETIAEHVVALGDFINQTLPHWGWRRAKDETDPGGGVEFPKLIRRYCVQIAANIQDYIDEDHQPTVIMQDMDTPRWMPSPTEGGQAPQQGDGAPPLPPAAFGKEAVPMITEYLTYMYGESNKLRIDHTFEILNIFAKPIDLANLGTVQLLMAGRQRIVPPSGGGAALDMAGVGSREPLAFQFPSPPPILPAGRYSVLTTAPTSGTGAQIRAQTQFQATADKWTPLNWIMLSPRENLYTVPPPPPSPPGASPLQFQGDTNAQAADSDTEAVIVNQYGYLDVQARISQQGSVNLNGSIPPNQSKNCGSQPFGNDPPSGDNSIRSYSLDSGDPRSNTDVYPQYGEATGQTSPIAWRRNSVGVGVGLTVLGGDSNNGSSGFLPENDNLDPKFYVPEPMMQTGTATPQQRNLAVIRDGDMKTIGELGFIYDPAVPEVSLMNGTYRRGGFRTLAIGTRNGETDQSGSGTLTKLPQTLWKFTDDKPTPLTDTAKRLTALRAYRLLDILDTTYDQRGRILVNSVLRDPRNYPLRAVFYNLKTQKDDPDYYD